MDEFMIKEILTANDLDKLICGLGIKNVGSKLAKVLAKQFKTMENLINASFISLNSIDEVGEIIANSIYDFFRQEQTIDLIEKYYKISIDNYVLVNFYSLPKIIDKMDCTNARK